jgi:hypothetical protein
MYIILYVCILGSPVSGDERKRLQYYIIHFNVERAPSASIAHSLAHAQVLLNNSRGRYYSETLSKGGSPECSETAATNLATVTAAVAGGGDLLD